MKPGEIGLNDKLYEAFLSNFSEGSARDNAKAELWNATEAYHDAYNVFRSANEKRYPDEDELSREFLKQYKSDNNPKNTGSGTTEESKNKVQKVVVDYTKKAAEQSKKASEEKVTKNTSNMQGMGTNSRSSKSNLNNQSVQSTDKSTETKHSGNNKATSNGGSSNTASNGMVIHNGFGSHTIKVMDSLIKPGETNTIQVGNNNGSSIGKTQSNSNTVTIDEDNAVKAQKPIKIDPDLLGPVRRSWDENDYSKYGKAFKTALDQGWNKEELLTRITEVQLERDIAYGKYLGNGTHTEENEKKFLAGYTPEEITATESNINNSGDNSSLDLTNVGPRIPSNLSNTTGNLFNGSNTNWFYPFYNGGLVGSGVNGTQISSDAIGESTNGSTSRNITKVPEQDIPKSITKHKNRSLMGVWEDWTTFNTDLDILVEDANKYKSLIIGSEDYVKARQELVDKHPNMPPADFAILERNLFNDISMEKFGSETHNKYTGVEAEILDRTKPTDWNKVSGVAKNFADMGQSVIAGISGVHSIDMAQKTYRNAKKMQEQAQTNYSDALKKQSKASNLANQQANLINRGRF